MIKIDDRYFLDFTEELLPVIVYLRFLAPNHKLTKELFAIYQTYLELEKSIDFSTPCIISLNANSLVVKYLESLKKDGKLNLSENPLEYRKNNYILLTWPIVEPVKTR